MLVVLLENVFVMLVNPVNVARLVVELVTV